MTEILLLPGGGRTSADWRLAAPLLEAAGFRTVAVELPDLGSWSWAGAVQSVDEAINDHGMEHPAVVGHSLGGIVAALWASEHPACSLAVNLDGHTNPTGPFAGVDSVGAEHNMRAFLAEQTAGDPVMTHLIARMDAVVLGFVLAGVARPHRRLPGGPLSPPRRLLQRLGSECDVASCRLGGLRRLCPRFARGLKTVAAQTPLLSLADLATGHDTHLAGPAPVGGGDRLPRRPGHRP
ncbi:alpha/beta fold hydrolase [Nonomuraea longicatena]